MNKDAIFEDIINADDFSTAKSATTISKLNALRERAKLKEQTQAIANNVLDDDVIYWLNHQDNSTKRHINEVIRHFMAFKPLPI
nr:hypothetical protein [uncultured Moraxella sp.]